MVDINATDCDFNTPLHIASELGNVHIADYLLEHGADGKHLYGSTL